MNRHRFFYFVFMNFLIQDPNKPEWIKLYYVHLIGSSKSKSQNQLRQDLDYHLLKCFQALYLGVQYFASVIILNILQPFQQIESLFLCFILILYQIPNKLELN